jgi:hypothetical protein
MHGAEPALSIAVQPGFPADMDRAAAAASPSHAFLRSAWYAAAGGADKLTLVATRPDGQIVAAIPTVAVGPPLLRMRATPGSYWPIRSVPIAIDASDAELEALLASPQARRALGRAWRLGPVNADDPAASRLVQTARQAGWSVLRRRIATSFRLDIAAARSAGPWPRSSTLKKNRFHEKHLAAHGELRWSFLSGADWTCALFDKLASIEQASWVGQDHKADPKFLDPRQRAIWQEAARDRCSPIC